LFRHTIFGAAKILESNRIIKNKGKKLLKMWKKNQENRFSTAEKAKTRDFRVQNNAKRQNIRSSVSVFMLLN
jgi:uncharacterized membrane protein